MEKELGNLCEKLEGLSVVRDRLELPRNVYDALIWARVNDVFGQLDWLKKEVESLSADARVQQFIQEAEEGKSNLTN